jgi:hypothetical protein
VKFGSVSDVTKYSVTALRCEFCKIAVAHRNYSRSSSKFECHAENKYWFINGQISQTLGCSQSITDRSNKCRMGISTPIFLSRSLRDFRFFNSYGLAIQIVQNILREIEWFLLCLVISVPNFL